MPRTVEGPPPGAVECAAPLVTSHASVPTPTGTNAESGSRRIRSEPRQPCPGAWSGARVVAVPRAIGNVDLERAGDAILVALHGASRLDADERWFASLPAAIDRFDRVRIILPSATHTVIATLTGSARWRWLRARKPLAAYA